MATKKGITVTPEQVITLNEVINHNQQAWTPEDLIPRVKALDNDGNAVTGYFAALHHDSYAVVQEGGQVTLVQPDSIRVESGLGDPNSEEPIYIGDLVVSNDGIVGLFFKQYPEDELEFFYHATPEMIENTVPTSNYKVGDIFSEGLGWRNHFHLIGQPPTP